MKKGIKKIAFLASVTIMTLSSMSVFAAEARATVCPDCMSASVTPRSIVTSSPTAEYKTTCLKDNTKKDTILQYERYTEYRCNNCNTFVDSVFAGIVEKRVCSH